MYSKISTNSTEIYIIFVTEYDKASEYIYIYMCVCVKIYGLNSLSKDIYICVCVCVLTHYQKTHLATLIRPLTCDNFGQTRVQHQE
jgi:hypothetical protein